MKKIRVLHIAEIDNDGAKGTSIIIPQYVNEQSKCKNIEVGFFNCNDIKISKISKDLKSFCLTNNDSLYAVKEFKPDIVVFHEIYKKPYLKIYKFLLKKCIPYIIIPHGGMTKKAQSHKRLKKFFANILLFNDFFMNSSYIQYLSNMEKKNTCYKSLKSYVLGNGIDSIYNENLYLKKKKNNNLFNLVYVGRYDYKIKGLDQLLIACKLLSDNNIKNIKVNLYGVGDVGTIDKIKRFIRRNQLSDIISLNGPVFGKDKIEKLVSSDAFIQVSRTEGQPLGVMQALCLGMPVILSEGTGYKNIINQNKIGVCTRTNSLDIYDAIISLYNNRDSLDNYSINAYNYAMNNYKWDNIIKLTLEKYNAVLKEK